MTDTVDISVMLATFRRASSLERTLESFVQLTSFGRSWELIVVDNAGDPATHAVALRFADRLPLKFISHTQPGKNAALNAAVAVARGHLFVFTDDDVVAHADWLRELCDGAARWPDHAIFGGRILPAFPEPYPPFDLRNRNIIQAFAVADWQQGEGLIPNVFVYGPNMALRRELFDQRRFDETLYGPERKFMMADESSFLLKMQEIGHEAIYLPRALVHHQVRPAQLELSWLIDRAYRSGRTVAVHERSIRHRMLLGLPRFVFSELLWHRVAALCWTLRGERTRWFNSYLEHWFWRGKYHQYRIQQASGALAASQPSKPS